MDSDATCAVGDPDSASFTSSQQYQMTKIRVGGLSTATKVSAWNHAGDLKKLSQNCAVCAAIASLVTALRCGCYGGGCPKGLSEYRAGRRIKKNHYSDCLRLIINNYIILYCIILYYIIIYYIILHYGLYYLILYYIILYYIILYYIILYYYVISYHVILYYINEFSHLLLDFGPCVS